MVFLLVIHSGIFVSSKHLLSSRASLSRIDVNFLNQNPCMPSWPGTATTWKRSHYILSERSDFYMIYNLSIASHAFARRMLTSLSVDEILLLRHVNWSTNSKGALEVKIAPSGSKHMDSVLYAFTEWPMPPVACSRQ